jgi:hypothetical protein
LLPGYTLDSFTSGEVGKGYYASLLLGYPVGAYTEVLFEIDLSTTVLPYCSVVSPTDVELDKDY